MLTKHFLKLLSVVPLFCVHAHAADSPAYPTRPIRYVVAFPPGGVNDAIARILSQRMSDVFSVPVIVDNRPGAGGNLGSELVAKAAPDGHSLLNISTAQAISQSLYAKLGYNLERDLTPVILLATSPLIVALHPGVNARGVRDLVAASKTQPIRFSSGGIGTISHLSGEMLSRAVGFAGIHVPYKGGGPALNDVIGGQIEMTFIGAPASMPHIKSGRLRILAVSTAKRVAALPDVPTVAEAGYPGFEVGALYAVLAPAGTPAAIVGRLTTELARIVAARDIRERLNGLGLETVGGTPEQLTAFMTADVDKWMKLVQKIGLKTD